MRRTCIARVARGRATPSFRAAVASEALLATAQRPSSSANSRSSRSSTRSHPQSGGSPSTHATSSTRRTHDNRWGTPSGRRAIGTSVTRSGYVAAPIGGSMSHVLIAVLSAVSTGDTPVGSLHPGRHWWLSVLAVAHQVSWIAGVVSAGRAVLAVFKWVKRRTTSRETYEATPHGFWWRPRADTSSTPVGRGVNRSR